MNNTVPIEYGEFVGQPVEVPAMRVAGVPQWQPIETAPKDGTEILGWRDDCGPFMVKWTCVSDLRTTSDKDRDELDEDVLFSWDWFGGDAEGNFRADGSEAPTHWMHLPAPPGAAPSPITDAPATRPEAEKADAVDAKRYRHLRRWWCSTGDELIALMPEGIAAYESESEMDAAIDAAIASQEKQQ